MPLYTLTHGGLIHDRKHYPHGSEVELSPDVAADINREGPTVKLSAQIDAEAKAEEKKKEYLAKLTAEVEAKFKAETESKKGGGK